MTITVPQPIVDCVESLHRLNPKLGRVVLWLDETMQYGENWLPTLNIEGDDGFYRFPDMVRDEVAGFFGSNYQQARDLVDEVNLALGADAETVFDIVGGIMGRCRPW